jgi:hypothetical protein
MAVHFLMRYCNESITLDIHDMYKEGYHEEVGKYPIVNVNTFNPCIPFNHYHDIHSTIKAWVGESFRFRIYSMSQLCMSFVYSGTLSTSDVHVSAD